jgi:hypothetical protein
MTNIAQAINYPKPGLFILFSQRFSECHTGLSGIRPDCAQRCQRAKADGLVLILERLGQPWNGTFHGCPAHLAETREDFGGCSPSGRVSILQEGD